MAEAGGAYTPTLTVTSQTTLRRERRLPLPGETRVQVGERVTAQQVVAAAALPGRVTALNLAREMNVPPAEVARWLRKQVGEPLERGETIAQCRSFFGFFSASAVSPTSGTLEAVSALTGQALIRGPALPVELKAYLAGEVVEVLPGEAVTIEARCALVQGILGVGGEAYGELALLAASPGATPLPEDVAEEHRGRVLVAGGHLAWDTLARAREVGVAGIVVGSLAAADLDRLLGAPLGVAITGQEQVGLTLILTEGFGEMPMAQETFALLAAHAGQSVALNGATQIRAGVLRPEVVMPLGEGAAGREASAGARLAVGSRVRLVREPYTGSLGEVTALPAEPEVIATEARVRVLRARLDDGREVTVPRANVELIQR